MKPPLSLTLHRRDIARLFGRLKLAPNGCWEWQGKLIQGYGRTEIGGEHGNAHRLMYAWVCGPIPRGHGWHVDHAVCQNRRCCNPVHLELVTARVNTLRGNGITAQQIRRNHCAAGHLYTDENTRIRPSDGSRLCRNCRRQHSQKAYRRKKLGKATVSACT